MWLRGTYQTLWSACLRWLPIALVVQHSSLFWKLSFIQRPLATGRRTEVIAMIWTRWQVNKVRKRRGSTHCMFLLLLCVSDDWKWILWREINCRWQANKQQQPSETTITSSSSSPTALESKDSKTSSLSMFVSARTSSFGQCIWLLVNYQTCASEPGKRIITMRSIPYNSWG